LIRTRHVFYVEGYDPQGAEGYYRFFRREWSRFLKTWPIEARLDELQIDSDKGAHWNIEARAPNWKVETRYEFLRLEHLIRANMAQPLWRQLFRAIRWMLEDLVSGALLHIFRASWGFALHLIYPQVMIILWFATAIGSGWFAAILATRLAGLTALGAVVVALAVAIPVFAALRPLADRWFVMQIANCWPYLREFGRGQASGYAQPIDCFAERIVAAARANEVDEILIIGHSAGGAISPVVVARAFELDPALGRRGPRIVLMTVGSLLPALTLDPSSGWLRGVIRRLAAEPSLLWVDCQARKDWMNFWNFDPFEGVGVAPGQRLCNFRIWQVRYRDLVTAESYSRLQWNLFRMHYQFIMANDRRAAYDYFMLVCGPVPVADWAMRSREVLAGFSECAAYTATIALSA
jgi:hypothetical protein